MNDIEAGTLQKLQSSMYKTDRDVQNVRINKEYNTKKTYPMIPVPLLTQHRHMVVSFTLQDAVTLWPRSKQDLNLQISNFFESCDHCP